MVREPGETCFCTFPFPEKCLEALPTDRSLMISYQISILFSKAWRELGAVSRDEAMASFVFLVDRVCPPFKGFIADKRAM